MTTPPPRFRLRVLGDASLTVEGTPGIVLGAGKALALLAYLAFAPKRSATREHLVDLLWADTNPHQGRRNLRQALYQLRRLLDDEAIAGNDHTLSLVLDLASDRDEFLGALDAGDVARAFVLYKGPFFPMFAAPGGVEFEYWADVERRRLQGAYLRAGEMLVRESIQQQQLREAVNQAQALHDMVPESEHAWRLLVEATVSASDWTRAATEADTLEAWLRELGRPPEPATAATLRAARQAPSDLGPAGERPIVADLVGRESEFATLLAAWGEASGGNARHVHVSGAVGIGKTRLLRDFAARLTAGGACVVALKGHLGERDLAYALAGDLARALAALPGAGGGAPESGSVLVDLDPSLSTRFRAARAMEHGPDLLRRRTMALSDVLASVCEEQPVALIVDDLQWLDPASLQILLGMAARSNESSLLLVTAARPPGGATRVGEPDKTLVLRPLTVAQVGQLVESVGLVSPELRDGTLIEAVCDATDGTPLLVLETIQFALEQGWADWDGTRLEFGEPEGLLRLLREGGAIEHRLTALGPAERRVLLVLAVAGVPVPRAVLDGVTRRLALGAAPVVADLERAGLVAAVDGAWLTAHDLVSEKILATANREQLREAHAVLGQAWAAGLTGDPQETAIAVRLLAGAGETETVVGLFRRHERACRAAHDWRPPAHLAAELLGPGHAALVPHAVRGLGVARRWRLHQPARRAAVAAGLLLLAVGSAGLASRPRADHLMIRQMPRIAGGPGSPPLVVEVVDARGFRVKRADTVRIALGRGAEHHEITSRDWAVAKGGVAVFDTLEIAVRGIGDGVVTLVATAHNLRSVESDTIAVGALANFLHVDSIRIGDAVLPAGVPIRGSPGEHIEGTWYVQYTSVAGPAAVLATGIPSWGNRRTNFFPVSALVPNAFGRRDSWPVEFTLPPRPGTYHLMVIVATETEARFIASGTNWVFDPVWNDGNDIADFGPGELALLRAGKLVPWRWFLLDEPFTGRTIRSPRDQGRIQARFINGTVIDVEVR